MRVREDLSKKIIIFNLKLKEKEKKVDKLLKEFIMFFNREKDNYYRKIQKKCDERNSLYLSEKDENKTEIYKNTITSLETLLKEKDSIINNLSSALTSLKTFLLKDVNNLFPKEGVNSKEKQENNNKLVIKNTDDCEKGKAILNSREGEKLDTLHITWT